MDRIWYVSYGSNMDASRFKCYLEGGAAQGSDMAEVGCKDQGMYEDEKWVSLPHPLYFSKSSSRWQGGGVLFLDDETSGEAIGKAYKVTWDQFLDITKQECGLAVSENLNVTMDHIITKGYRDIGNHWYGRIVYLGMLDYAPMFTFTVPSHLKTDIKSPSSNYIARISEGLRGKGMVEEEISNYLLLIKGFE